MPKTDEEIAADKAAEEEAAKAKVGAAPAVDADAIAAAVGVQMTKWAEENLNKEPVTPEPTPSSVTPVPTEANPLKEAVDAYTAPGLAAAKLDSQAARDGTIFYAAHPEAQKYMKEIEGAFDKLVQQGTPFSHDAVWEWYQGKNFQKFHTEAVEADKLKLEDAENAETISQNGQRPVQKAKITDPHSASDDELDKAMESMEF